MEEKFCISGVNIAVISDACLRAEGKWKLFSSEHRQGDMTYRIHRSAFLPEAQGEKEYEDSRVRCLRDGTTALRQYLTSRGEAYCLVRQTESGCWDIYTREEDLPWGSGVSHYFEAFDLTHALLPFDVVLLHCAYILTDRGAILFTAPSGTGKSTQAELWRKHRGTRIVNGDRAALRCKDGALWVWGLPFSGSSDCCENISAPVLAIVGLSQAPENRLSRLNGRMAVQELLQGIYCLPEHRDELPQIFDLCVKMAESVPVYHLACLPELSAVALLEDELDKLVLPNV